MTEFFKIICDDCKFCEECVDYGWQGCRKFTPKPTELMTNEEWFCSLPTERKAYFFAERFGGSADRFNDIKDSMLRWLKEIHNEMP